MLLDRRATSSALKPAEGGAEPNPRVTSAELHSLVGVLGIVVATSLVAQGCESSDSENTSGADSGGGGVGEEDAQSGGAAGVADAESGGADGGTNPRTAEGGAGGVDTDADGAGSGGDGGGEPGGTRTFLPLYENGTRLRAVSLGAVGSSARRFVTWYDTELEVECEFGRAEDGETRCIPRTRDLTNAFLDEDCTDPVIYDSRTAPCSHVPPFRRETVAENACSALRVVRLEPVDTDTVHRACNGTPTELREGATVWKDGEVVDSERLVRATERVRVDDRGFGVRELLGEDGSRQVLSMVDAEHGRCIALEVNGAGLRCVPATPASLESGWWFADAECEAEPLAYAPMTPCVDPPEFALAFDVSTRTVTSVLRVGAAVTGTVYELDRSTGDCVPRDSTELIWTLFPIEGDYDPTRFFELTEVARGDGSLQPIHHAIDGEPLVVPNGLPLFYDTEDEVRCAAERLGDGFVCVPLPSVRQHQLRHYADENCSERIVSWAGDDPPNVVLQIEYASCSRYEGDERVVAAYAVRETHSGSVYENRGECVEVAPGDTPYYRLEAIEPDFPELDETIE